MRERIIQALLAGPNDSQAVFRESLPVFVPEFLLCFQSLIEISLRTVKIAQALVNSPDGAEQLRHARIVSQPAPPGYRFIHRIERPLRTAGVGINKSQV